MKKRLDKKGFTLIEMLVVIAIIAVLVAIIIPVVVSSTDKAEAAVDAANLRSVLGQANSLLMTNNADDGSLLQSAEFKTGECKTFPGADMYIMYVNPGFIKIFYYDEDNDLYYGLDYFSAIAEKGSTTLIGLRQEEAENAHDVTSTPTWYIISDPNSTGGEGA